MGNSFGIALSRAWIEWAAKQGVSETIASALYLLSENRKAAEVVDKLTSGEFPTRCVCPSRVMTVATMR